MKIGESILPKDWFFNPVRASNELLARSYAELGITAESLAKRPECDCRGMVHTCGKIN